MYNLGEYDLFLLFVAKMLNIWQVTQLSDSPHRADQLLCVLKSHFSAIVFDP